ncbi:MAG: hypothetical protein M1457_01455 [bacterium]|nr:hypothetical protein [bacterium]
MSLAKIQLDEIIRLRSRYFPGHRFARMDQRITNRVDLPAGSLARVVHTHGTDILVEVFPDPSSMTERGVEIWVPLHMMDVLFEAAEAGVAGDAGDVALLANRSRKK